MKLVQESIYEFENNFHDSSLIIQDIKNRIFESKLYEIKFEYIKKEDIINKDIINYYIGQGLSNELFMYTYANEYGLDPEKMDVEEWENTKEGRDWIKYEIENCFYETMNRFRYEILDGDNITIWRKMSVGPDWLNHLQKEGKRLGIYWSWDPKAAEEHWGYDSTKKLALIQSSVKEDYIDWINTIRLNMDPSYSEEREIRLFKNTSLKIEKLWIDDIEIDITPIKNKIFKS